MPQATEYIHDTAELLGRYDRKTTTTLGSTTSLVCSDYINSVLAATEYANFAVLIESGACSGQQGMVGNSGFAKATGTFSLATTFTSLIASGVVFSLYDAERLPALRGEAGRPGLLQMANQALARTWAEDTLAFAGVSDQTHYTINTTTYPWFTDDTRIIEILSPVTNADDVPCAMPRESWEWVSDGETRKLRFPGKPFTTSQTFGVKVNRPGNSRLKLNATARATIAVGAVTAMAVTAGGYYTTTPSVTITGGGGTGATATATVTGNTVVSIAIGNGGSGYTSVPTVTIAAGEWADQATQTAGLGTLTDEAIVDVTVLRPMMLARAYAQLAVVGAPGRTAAEWIGLSKEWETVAVSKKARRLPRDATQGVIRMQHVAMGSRYGLVG